MKKLILFPVLLILIGTSVFSQPYHPMLDSVSNIWHYTGNILPVRTSSAPVTCNYPNFFWFMGYKAITNGDTTISGITYKKLEEHSQPSAFSDVCLYGYLREDTVSRKVYFMDNTLAPEILLYDFSMQPGDSIYYDFMIQWYYQSGYYKLDSIVTMNIAAGPRKVFYLRNYSAPAMQFQMQWIEGVGHPGHLVFTHAENATFGGGWFWGCIDTRPRDYFQVLTCFEHQSQKVYFDTCAFQQGDMNPCFFFEDSCSYYNAFCGSLNEQTNLYHWSIGPNPANETFSVSVESSAEGRTQLFLWDLKGVRIRETEIPLHPGINKYEIDCSGIPAGIYAAEIKGSYRKLIIAR